MVDRCRSIAILRLYFRWVASGAKIVELIKLLGTVIKQQRKTIVTVCSLIALSSIMDFSGMISQLGLALAIATGSLYPLFAPTIGCLGTFLTGSDTSSNILFGKLQASVAHTTGADPSWSAAAKYSRSNRWEDYFSAKYSCCYIRLWIARQGR